VKHRGVCVSPARSFYSATFRESTLISAKRLGFTAVRFNPGIDDLLADTVRGEVIPVEN